jgi:hypothetical protein
MKHIQRLHGCDAHCNVPSDSEKDPYIDAIGIGRAQNVGLEQDISFHTKLLSKYDLATLI